MKYRRTTITKIAKAAKTSPSTVSRALNDDPRISQKTKNKVIKLAREMEYTPTLLSQGLDKKKTSLIGLLMYSFSHFYGRLSRSIQETAERLGYWVIQGYTELAYADLPESNPARAKLQQVMESSEHAATLVRRHAGKKGWPARFTEPAHFPERLDAARLRHLALSA